MVRRRLPPSQTVIPAKVFAEAKAASRDPFIGLRPPSGGPRRASPWTPDRCRVRGDSLWCTKTCAHLIMSSLGGPNGSVPRIHVKVLHGSRGGCSELGPRAIGPEGLAQA